MHSYDANGLRVGKSVYFYDELYESTEYMLEDDRIIREVYTVEGESVVSYYYYDENGMPVAWNYDGDMYYYIKNQQGDIVEIVNESGVTKVTYTYDAWGNTISHTGNAVLFNMNPFRYRGYYYDIDTGFYYLQSRYYDPEVGRFLNADSTDYLGASGTVLGYNLYAYCENSFVNYIDLCGYTRLSVANLIYNPNSCFGSYYRNSNKTIYYWGHNSPQRAFGYCNFYDQNAHLAGCDISTLKIIFKTSDGKEWRIQLWKGSYVFGSMYGAEIGVYYRYSWYPEGWYQSASDSNCITMSFSLYSKYPQKHLFSTRTRTTWWQTGFVFGDQSKSSLKMMARFTFNSNQDKLRNSFTSQLRRKGIVYKVNNKTITITW